MQYAKPAYHQKLKTRYTLKLLNKIKTIKADASVNRKLVNFNFIKILSINHNIQPIHIIYTDYTQCFVSLRTLAFPAFPQEPQQGSNNHAGLVVFAKMVAADGFEPSECRSLSDITLLIPP